MLPCALSIYFTVADQFWRVAGLILPNLPDRWPLPDDVKQIDLPMVGGMTIDEVAKS
jgi:hypothetical protein